MEKQEFKKVTIKNREFIIRKFDALTGSYTLLKVGGIFAPFLKNIDLTKIDINADKSELIKEVDIASIAGGLTRMPEEDFMYIQRKCLQVCYESLPAGSAQVLTNQNTPGINDFDFKLAMALTIQALIFNITDFFGEDLSSFLLEGLNLSQQN